MGAGCGFYFGRHRACLRLPLSLSCFRRAFLGLAQGLANSGAQGTIGCSSKGALEVAKVLTTSQLAAVVIVNDESHPQVIGKRILHRAQIRITEVNSAQFSQRPRE